MSIIYGCGCEPDARGGSPCDDAEQCPNRFVVQHEEPAPSVTTITKKWTTEDGVKHGWTRNWDRWDNLADNLRAFENQRDYGLLGNDEALNLAWKEVNHYMKKYFYSEL